MDATLLSSCTPIYYAVLLDDGNHNKSVDYDINLEIEDSKASDVLLLIDIAEYKLTMRSIKRIQDGYRDCNTGKVRAVMILIGLRNKKREIFKKLIKFCIATLRLKIPMLVGFERPSAPIEYFRAKLLKRKTLRGIPPTPQLERKAPLLPPRVPTQARCSPETISHCP